MSYFYTPRHLALLVATLALASCNDNKKSALAPSHTLTFNSQGGTPSIIEPLTVARNTLATPPQQEPSKKDDATIFDRPLEGWYTDVNLQNKFNFATTSITADIVLYAKYDQSVYLISTEDQLKAVVTTDLAGHYRLKKDIELSTTNKWTPLGSSVAPFIGRFEGRGYVIKNLNIDANSFVGLFGVVGKGGVVQSLGVEVGLIEGLGSVGALVGESQGTVRGLP